MKKTIYLIISLFILTSLGCKKYLDVNHNVDAPDHVEGYLYLANITQQYTSIYWDIRAIGPMTQMMGTTSYTNFADMYYFPGSDAAGEIWKMAYWNQGMNLENMINQSMGAEDWTLAGIGYAIKAFSWDEMTKVYGELPMKEAFVPGKLAFDYDYQDSIYTQVRDWAHKAIDLLQKDDPHDYGTKISSNDYIYHGDKSKWIKFAYAVIVRNLSSLSNKSNFVSDYAPELIDAAKKSFQTSDDDATVEIAGGSQAAPYSAYNNFWGTARGNLSLSYFQHEYAVQVFTGRVPEYDQSTGNKIPSGNDSDPYNPYELAPNQIITDTLVNEMGHYDPRVAVKLATTSDPDYVNIDNADSVKAYQYYGGSFTSRNGSIGTAPSFYGRNYASSYSGATNDGIGRWLYRDNAPYILTTCAEIKFCLAEAYWKTGDKEAAFEAFKDGVKADMDFTAKYIYPGTKGSPTGGDKITKDLFLSLAAQYEAGPFVAQLPMADFSLSNIMMQKWVALYPWGAPEAWVDERKYHYDINYTGDFPSEGNGFTTTTVDQKWDTDPTKVYKGLYLLPAQVDGRRGAYNQNNDGSPSYRIRPRYNSEYMWNLAALKSLQPIPGTADNYHTSIPWFAYPNGYPF
ncbi:MAG: SusD/RagB family nutrient-binding outer membrane lipoprotein [Ginsengibacter sp.]